MSEEKKKERTGKKREAVRYERSKERKAVIAEVKRRGIEIREEERGLNEIRGGGDENKKERGQS